MHSSDWTILEHEYEAHTQTFYEHEARSIR
jgi:hypothetical protein